MKKRICAAFLAFMLVISLVPSALSTASANTGGFTPVTGYDMMERLGIGYTFVNTTEARSWMWAIPPSPTSETVWGQPFIREWHFQALAAKGFDSYRLLVTWTPYFMTEPFIVPPEYTIHTPDLPNPHGISPDFDSHSAIVEWATNADFTIDPVWLDRIQELVDQAMGAGLNVVINTHHEEELYWLIRYNEFELAEKMLNAIWTQVAERFAYYPEGLVFEILNEPHLLQYYQGPGHWISRDGISMCQELVSMVNRLNESALNLIRSSGGFNDRRVVILGIPGAASMAIPYLAIPDCQYVMVGAFGYYCHWNFTNETSLGFMQSLLDRGIGFVNKEDAVIGLGEHPTLPPYRHARNHFGRFAQMGIPSFYVSPCAAVEADFGLLNRATGEWYNTAVLQELFQAYGRTMGQTISPPIIPRHTIYSRTNVQVLNRVNLWDGLDIAIAPLNMDFAANDYIITVRGRVANAEPTYETRVSLNGQDAPWNWRFADVIGNNSFTIIADIGKTYGVVNPSQFEQGFRIQTHQGLACLIIDEFTIERIGEAPTPTPPTVARPAGQLGITINGVEQTFNPPPMEIGGSMMLPFRAIGEALGMTVSSSGGVVTLTAPGVNATHVARTNVITVNGTAHTFAAPSTAVEGRLLMPLRMFGAIPGINVRWDSPTRTAVVTTE